MHTLSCANDSLPAECDRAFSQSAPHGTEVAFCKGTARDRSAHWTSARPRTLAHDISGVEVM